MNIPLYLAASCSVLAVAIAFLAFFAVRWRRKNEELPAAEIAQLIRSESDRIRAASAEQGRRMRQELAENLRGFQTATLPVFSELGRQLGGQIREFGEKLEAGLRLIDERASGIDARLDAGLELRNGSSSRFACRATIASTRCCSRLTQNSPRKILIG